MDSISKIKVNRNMVIIFSISILMFIGLCILCYHLYIKVDRLTNINYFPPEVETMLLAEINVSQSEVLSIENIENAVRDVSEGKVEFKDFAFKTFTEYDSMPDSIQLLIDEFLEGFILRKEGKVTKEELIPKFRFYVSEYQNIESYIFFTFGYSSIDYTYTYFLNGVIRKTLQCDFTSGIKDIYSSVHQDEIDTFERYDSRTYRMTNTGEFIKKDHLTNLEWETYNKQANMKVSIEDYNLFHSDYLEGKLPGDFVITFKNIRKYVDRKYR